MLPYRTIPSNEEPDLLYIILQVEPENGVPRFYLGTRERGKYNLCGTGF